MLKRNKLPKQAVLHRLLDYDPLNGQLTWRKNGSRADYQNGSGKRYVTLFGETYLASRIIWVWMRDVDPGTNEIDHKNHDHSDNRFSNLRFSTRSQNQGNRRRKQGKTLPKGVLKTRSGRFAACCCRKHLGTFDTPEEAQKAYDAEASTRWGVHAFSD